MKPNGHNDGCKLTNVQLTRAEKLTPEIRKEHNLPNKGMVAWETWVCEDDCKAIKKVGLSNGEKRT